MTRLLILAGFIMATTATVAVAQTQASPPPPAPVPFTCADFRHNADKSWTPLQPITLGGKTFGTDASIKAGTRLGNFDLGGTLNAECISR